MFNVLSGLLGRRAEPGGDKPLRDELLSIERLEERAKALAARFTHHLAHEPGQDFLAPGAVLSHLCRVARHHIGHYR